MTCGCSNLGREAQITEIAAVNAELKAKLAAVRAEAQSHIGAPCDCNAIAYRILAILDGGTND